MHGTLSKVKTLEQYFGRLLVDLSSRWVATFGKKRLGLKRTDAKGLAHGCEKPRTRRAKFAHRPSPKFEGEERRLEIQL